MSSFRFKHELTEVIEHVAINGEVLLGIVLVLNLSAGSLS
jgi:hypothetical protein